MLYGRLWKDTRTNFWSVHIKNRKVLIEAQATLNARKEATRGKKQAYSYQDWHLESLKLSEVPKDLREFVKKPKENKYIETGEDIITYIDAIHAFWAAYL